MKRIVLAITLLLVATSLAVADNVVSDTVCNGDICYTDPATLQLGASLPPAGADPNLFSGNSIYVYQNQGGAAALNNPWLLILGVPNTSAANPFGSGITSLVPSAGGPTSWSYLGFQTSMGPGQEAYSVLGVQGPTDNSNSFGNWAGADQSHDGITATSFGLYEFAISANLGAKQNVQITLGNVPAGTIAIAYGQVITTSTSTKHGHTVTTTNVTIFDTPFTQAGLETHVPEPGSMMLLGAGVLGLSGLRRFRK